MQGKIGDSVIVAGTATKDAAVRRVGAKNSVLCSFSLAVGKAKDTTTIFANCNAWRGLGEYASEIRKGDSVCVIGKIEENEYNGKIYHNLVAEWLNFSPSGRAFSSAQPTSKGANAASAIPSGDGFSEVSDADFDELPF